MSYKHIAFVAVLFLSTVLFLASSVSAQPSWQLKATFPHQMNFVTFVDGNNGFVGLGLGPGGILGTCAIYKTSDGGNSWNACTIPANYTGSVTGVLMLDGLNGLASVCPWQCAGNNGLWRTTDGGLSWAETGIMGACTSISQSGSAIILTDIFGNVHISRDQGQTFIDLNVPATNDAIFVDAMHGMITDYRGNGWYVTSDGGLTWNTSNEVVESWGAYPIAGTKTFFAAPEGYTNGTPWQPQILRSDDYGLNWTTVSSLNFHLTGCVAGIGNRVLYVQPYWGVGGNVGIHRSTDQGKTWTDIGGPQTWVDTRFCVVDHGCQGVAVWAFDAPGNLYEYLDEGQTDSGAFINTHGSVDTAVQPLSLVDIPVRFDVSTTMLLDTMQIDKIYYSVDYNSNVIDMNPSKLSSYIVVPPTLALWNAAIQQDNLSVILNNPSGTTLTNKLDVGNLLFTAYQSTDKSTIVRLNSFAIESKFGMYYYCVELEGNYIGLVRVLDAGVAELATTNQIVVFPNPTETGKAQLGISLAKSASVECTLYDILGRELGRTGPTVMTAGNSRRVIPSAELSPGNYYIRTTISGEVVTHKLVVQ